MWKPIESLTDLPPIGTRESPTCDFKASLTDDDFEIAKDTAAFANANGGTILIGAAGGDRLEKFLPLSKDEASAASRASELAIRDRCRPSPLFSLIYIPKDAGVLVALNVWPFPGQLVGVRLKKGEAQCGPRKKEAEDIFFYPRRSGTDTKSITPEQIPMFIDARVRRVAIQLETEVGKQAVLIAAKYREPNANWISAVTIEKVDTLKNTLTVAIWIGDSLRAVAIPLDAVTTVAHSMNGLHIYIAGVLSTLDPNGRDPSLVNVDTYFDPLG